MAPLNPFPLLVEEPIRLSSVLEASQLPKTHHSLTKILGTVGGNSRTVEQLAQLLEAGMTAARFDLSFESLEYHLETLQNLKAAMRKVDKLCAVMLDTAGPELNISNKCGAPIQLKEGDSVTLRCPTEGEDVASACADASNALMWLSLPGMHKHVRAGGEIFVGQYLATGSEGSSVWLKVKEIQGNDIICKTQNSAVLKGEFFNVHVSQVHIPLPTLREEDKSMIASWFKRAGICDIVSLSFTRFATDVEEAKEFLASIGARKTQVFAKIENIEGLQNFDGILGLADGIILGRGDLGIDLPAEKVFLFQKEAIQRCNLAGKPVVISRVVDTMTDTPRPTRAEATDVANAVLDGVDAIMLGAETLRGLYPVDTVKTVEGICWEAEKVFNQASYLNAVVEAAPEPMSELESICCSAVTTAENIRASCLVVFTITTDTARCLAKYKPSMPAILLVVPTVTSNQLTWTFSGDVEARQSLLLRGAFPVLASEASLLGSGNETLMRGALAKGKAMGIIKPRDRVVIVQKMKASWVARVLEA